MSDARTATTLLMEEGSAARGHFQVWWALRNRAFPKYETMMNEHADFFNSTSAAHFKSFFLALSKIFDRDTRASGVTHLKEALRKEGHSEVAERFDKAIEPFAAVVQRIMKVRNKSIVHNEWALPRDKVFERYGLSPDEIRSLIDLTCGAINDVAEPWGLATASLMTTGSNVLH